MYRVGSGTDADVDVESMLVPDMASVLYADFPQWILLPCERNFEALPNMMKPTLLQCRVPHVAAIELIPYPSLRDACVSRLPERLIPLKRSTWSVNWPFSMHQAMERNDSTGRTQLTAAFVEHALIESNWSVGESFIRDFPELEGKVRVCR